MRNAWLVCVILFLSASWVVAQSGGGGGGASGGSSSGGGSTAGNNGGGGGNNAPGSPGTMQNQNQGSGNPSDAETSNKVSVEGCLSGSSGTYTLTANNGATYQLQGKDSELNKHVGEEVKIKGKPAAGSGGMASNASPSGTAGGSSASGTQVFQVSKVKKVSKTCTSGNTSNPTSR